MDAARTSWDHIRYAELIAPVFPLIAEEIANLAVMFVSNAPVESALSHAGRVDAQRRTRLSPEMTEAMTRAIVRRDEFAACLRPTVSQWAAGIRGWDASVAGESEPGVMDGLLMSDDEAADDAGRVLAAQEEAGDGPFPVMREEDDAFPRLPPEDW
jgi:hypothetical protein